MVRGLPTDDAKAAMKLLVTGGAGFIGSEFIRLMMGRRDVKLIVNLDKLTYAGHLEGLKEFVGSARYRFVRGDIANGKMVQGLMAGMDGVVNFAAETHVDRSIQDAAPFLHSNVIGVHVLLEAARKSGVKRFVQVSTDEVYGSVRSGFASETAVLKPSSPYSASKAAADHLAMSYFTTYGTPVVITRAANNYGPYQYPEKFLPLFITHALEDQALPLYGDGLNVRDWLHVRDHCLGIEAVLRKGNLGEIYNIGTQRGFSNVAIAKTLLRALGKPPTLLRYVKDRPGHDRRYAMSIRKMDKDLGWKPQIRFEEGLKALVDWYRDHQAWWRPILMKSEAYKTFYKQQYTPGRA